MIVRTFRGLFQLLGGLAVGIVIILGLVGWRLTSGPISLAFLSPYFETALTAPDGSYRVELEDTILDWSGGENLLEIRLRGAKAIDRSGEVMAEFSELAVSLSGSALLRGELAPRSVALFGPSLNLIRRADGVLSLDLPGNAAPSQKMPILLLGRLLSPESGKGPLRYLRRVRIVGGDLTIEDRYTGQNWVAPEANIELVRQPGAVVGYADLDFRVGADQASLSLSGRFDTLNETATIDLGFASLQPRVLSGMFPAVTLAGMLDAPVSGTVTATVDNRGSVQSAEFVFSAERGHLSLDVPVKTTLPIASTVLRGRYDRPDSTLLIEELAIEFPEGSPLVLPAPVDHALPLRGLTLTGRYFSDLDRLDVAKLSLDLDGPTAVLVGSVQEIGGDVSYEINGALHDLPVDRMTEYWPASWGAAPRRWIAENMAGGTLNEATVRLFGTWSKQHGFDIAGLNGDIQVDDTTVNFIDGMPKARGVSGLAKYNAKRMEIIITDGEAEGLRVRGGSVVFTELQQKDQYSDIHLTIEGSLPSTLSFIENEPLKFSSAVGIDPAATEGLVTTDLKLHFLVERALTIDRIRVAAVSRLRDVAVSGMLFGHDVEGGNFTIAADSDGMDLAGTAMVEGAATELEWRLNFDDSSAIKSRQSIKATLDDASRASFLGLGEGPFSPEYISGALEMNAVAVRGQDGSGDFFANFDLAGMELNIPQFAWRKAKGAAGRARLEAKLTTQGLDDVSYFSLGGGGLEVQGAVRLEDGKLRRVDVSKFELGDTSLAGVAIPGEGGWGVDVRGARLNLSPWLKRDKGEKDDDIGSPLTLSVNVDIIQLRFGHELHNAHGVLAYDGKHWQRIDLNARVGEDRMMTLDLKPENGKRRLKIESDDAGTVLRLFDYYDNMIGGELRLDAVYDDSKPHSPLAGTALVSNFRIVKAPLLTHVLSIAALTGILEALGGEGLAFAALEVPFTDDGRVIEFKDAKASGLSLGITGAGRIDTENEALHVTGTLVPAYIINSALGRLPIVGRVLTGGEEGGGIFAANYTLSGPVTSPKIEINPLSALAPGFLRNLFGIFEPSTTTPPPARQSN